MYKVFSLIIALAATSCTGGGFIAIDPGVIAVATHRAPREVTVVHRRPPVKVVQIVEPQEPVRIVKVVEKKEPRKKGKPQTRPVKTHTSTCLSGSCPKTKIVKKTHTGEVDDEEQTHTHPIRK